MATVKVRVHAARNLPVMDSVTGLADPYAVVKIDDAEQFTAIVHKTLDPVWDCAFTFDLSDFRALQEDPVEVRVYDHDILSRDALVGLVFVDLNSVLTTMTSPSICQWFPLSDSINGQRGELRLSVRVKFHSPENPFNPALPVRLVVPPLAFLEDTLANTRIPPNSAYRARVLETYRADALRSLRDTNTPLAVAKADKTLLSSVVEGVYLFPMSRLDPAVFRVERISSMVEELLIKADPEQSVRFGTFQSTRQLNEARQIQLFKLSGQVRSQLSQKVLGMQCNAVLGYSEEFDIEARTILVRAYGTPAVVSKVEYKPIVLPPWNGADDTTEDAVPNAAEEGAGSSQRKDGQPAGVRENVDGDLPATTSAQKASEAAENSNTVPPSKEGGDGVVAESVDAEGTAVSPNKGLVTADVDESNGTPQQRAQLNKSKRRYRKGTAKGGSRHHTARRTKNHLSSKRRPKGHRRHNAKESPGSSKVVDDGGASRHEVLLISLASLPNGSIIHVAGVVSAKSVKVVARVKSKKAITQERDSWWLEVRSEVRRNARSFHCNAVIGYSEETLYHGDVVVVIATGTAVVVDTSWAAFRRGPAELFYTAVKEFERNDTCSVLHCYDGTRAVRVRGEDTLVGGHVCECCGGYRVPEMLLLTTEAPSELELEGQHRLVEVVAVRAKPDVQGIDLAKVVSQALPMLEYSLHLQLTWKLKLCGFNAGFNFRARYATNSTLIIAHASVTGARIKGIPIPRPPTHQVTDETLVAHVLPLISHFKDRLQSLDSTRRSALGVLSTVLAMPSPKLTFPADLIPPAIEAPITTLIPSILASTPTAGWLDFTAFRGKHVFSFPAKGHLGRPSDTSGSGHGSTRSTDTTSRGSANSSSSSGGTNDTWGTTSNTSTTSSDSSAFGSASSRGDSSSSSESSASYSRSSRGTTSSTNSSSSESYLSDVSDDERRGKSGRRRRHGKAVRRRANLVREYNLRIEDEDDAQMVFGSVDSMADADTALLPSAYVPHHPHDFEVTKPIFVQRSFRVPPGLANSHRTSFVNSCVASVKRDAVSQLRAFAGARAQGIFEAVAEVERAVMSGTLSSDADVSEASKYLYATLNSGMDVGAATAVPPDVGTLGAVQSLMQSCHIPTHSFSLGADLLECVLLHYQQELFFPYDGEELVIIARGMVGGRYKGFLHHLMQSKGFNLSSLPPPTATRGAGGSVGLPVAPFDPCVAQLRALADVEAATGISSKLKTSLRSRISGLLLRDEMRDVGALESLPPASGMGSQTIPPQHSHSNNDSSDTVGDPKTAAASHQSLVIVPPAAPLGSPRTSPLATLMPPMGSSPVASLFHHHLILPKPSRHSHKDEHQQPLTPSVLPPTVASTLKTIMESFQQRAAHLERALYVAATTPFTVPCVLTTHYIVVEPCAPLEDSSSNSDEEGSEGGERKKPMSPVTATALSLNRSSTVTPEQVAAAILGEGVVEGGGGGRSRSAGNCPPVVVQMGPTTPTAPQAGHNFMQTISPPACDPTFREGPDVYELPMSPEVAEDAVLNGAVVSYVRVDRGFEETTTEVIEAEPGSRQQDAALVGAVGERGGVSDAHPQSGPKLLLTRLRGMQILKGGTVRSNGGGSGSSGGGGNRGMGDFPFSPSSSHRSKSDHHHSVGSSVGGSRTSKGIVKAGAVKRQWRAISSLASSTVRSWVGGGGPTHTHHTNGKHQSDHPHHHHSPISSLRGGPVRSVPFASSPLNAAASPVLVTSMEFVPGAAIVQYLGPVSHHFIREGLITVDPTDEAHDYDDGRGGDGIGSSRLTRFFEIAEAEMERVVCALVESVGGNALLCHKVRYHEVFESDGGNTRKVFIFATMTGYATRVSTEPLQPWGVPPQLLQASWQH